MNKGLATPPPSETGRYRDLQILDELSTNDALTQRDLSKRMGIALGLVNSYLKNLVAKGYITVSTIPTKRYGYYLTPKGFAEKTRLAYDLLQDYTRIYREARSGFQKLFSELERAGARKVLFAGMDEVAEIAFITLQETSLELVSVLDNDKAGEKFFGRDIRALDSVRDIPADSIIITSYLQREKLQRQLASIEGLRTPVKTIFTR